MNRTLPVTAIVLACATAWADPKVDAEQLFRIGADAYKAGKFDAAANNFEKAYELFKAPEIAFSAAQAHRLQYQADRDPIHVKRAIELFDAYIAGAPSGGKRKDALAHLERLREVLSKLEASGQKVVVVEKTTPAIYVSVAVDDALVTIDGKSVDRYTSVEVEPGPHTIAVSADGYFPEERKVSVGKGQALVPVELRPRPAALAIKTEPGARVVVDGRPMVLGGGTTEVPSGKRWVTVYARGREPVAKELDLAPGQEMTWEVPLRPTTRRRAVKWVLVGTGVLAAATISTSIVAVSANSGAVDLRDSTTPLDAEQAAKYERLVSRRDRFRNASLVLGGMTLAAAGAAVWMYWADTPSPDELARPVERAKPTGFAPMVFDGFGVQYTGGF
jgi:hypothetical protein